MTTSRPRKPTGLGSRGSRLWRDITSDYSLRADELRLLEAAAKTLDELARLERALASEDVTVAGSKGQTRAHPLVASIDSHRRLLASLVKQLDLPDAETGTGRSALSEKRSKAATTRWDRVRARRAGDL
jgi:hypothetical protein